MKTLLLAAMLAQQAPMSLSALSDGPITVGKFLYNGTITFGHEPFLFTVDGPGYFDKDGRPLTIGSRVVVIEMLLALGDNSMTCVLGVPVQ